MRNIPELIETIKNTPDCTVSPPQGIPLLKGKHALPADVIEFYKLCGGLSLFESSANSMEIVDPHRFVLINPVLLIGVQDKDLEETKKDRSWSWYIIGEGYSSQYLSIDLSADRLGRCYYSTLGDHANPGYMPVIAQSLTDLLNRLLENQGKEWYWFRDDFQSIGDAYD